MISSAAPTAEEVRKLFSYDKETGAFVRLVSTGSAGRAGAIVGSADLYGYLTVRIRKKSYKLHRLAWLYCYGEWPSGDIDHINGNRSDNRICNLRSVTRQVNLQNKRKAQSNHKTTGVLGVYPAKGNIRYCAAINISRRKIHLGTFDTVDEAKAAYIAAKRDMHIGCTI